MIFSGSNEGTDVVGLRLSGYLAFLDRILLALALLAPAGIANAQFPTPTYQSLTVLSGPSTFGGQTTFNGPTSLLGGGQFMGTFSGTSTITGLTAGLQNFTTTQLPTIGSPQPGWLVYNSNCTGGTGTGCPAYYNGTSWIPMLTPSTLTFTVGGQTISPGGATTNQGNGDLIQTATGATTNGDCPQYLNGVLVDSLAPCAGGSGGTGTVTAAPQNSMPFYSGGGSSSVLAGMVIVNNAVVSTDGSGIPAESTALPPGLSIPTPAIAGATLTGSTTIGPATYTGQQTYVASTVSLPSFNLPAGVAPTTPANGAGWATSAGLFYRANGTTQGPFVYNVSTSGPLGGGGVGPSLTLTCATCATISAGGALSATSPLTLTSGVFALGPQTIPLTWIADSSYIVHNDTYNLIDQSPWAGNGTVSKVIAHTGGITSPSFQLTLAICTGASCTNVGTCANLIINSTTDLITTCSAPNTLGPNQTLQQIISNVSGSPSSAVVQTNLAKPAA